MPNVDPQQLRDHAQHLDGLADAFGDVIGAGDHIVQDGEAYGLLCQWIPPILEERQQKQQDITELLQTNLGKIAAALREVADNYESTDDDTATSMKRIGSDIPGSATP
ncbi:Excreted virulence factor EspC, type VII ESX diderm [Glycomyces sambucus]|uniref:Excreted virulence factor EspC, type VII ESX diderm n=1 Tax=Glycomyces sambucus TaxID=380244 RepID=A0A1G9CEN3_9ACTN|nr:type VII secretion target [Glycomyces sambucus]SDK50102.1 Excreted virulence factor EspC, type VII ESX diderm [Glycomyces sambucus]